MSKSETCLVESYNGSIRNTLARFKRKTRASSRSLKSVYNSIIIWMNKSEIKNKDNKLKEYISIYYNVD